MWRFRVEQENIGDFPPAWKIVAEDDIGVRYEYRRWFKYHSDATEHIDWCERICVEPQWAPEHWTMVAPAPNSEAESLYLRELNTSQQSEEM